MEKTQIRKDFSWAFVLSEQDLRRLIQTCQEHFQKIPDIQTFKQHFSARLANGSIVESDKIDDIISLENSGSKLVQALTVRVDDGKIDYSKQNSPNPDWGVSIEFLADSDKWENAAPISYFIAGQSRDWVFLVSSELEERLRKTKTYALENILPKSLQSYALALAAFFGFLIGLFLAPSRQDVGTLLEQAYKTGSVKDPVEALIFIEKAKQQQGLGTVFGGLVGMVALASIAWFALKLLPWLMPSYTFYWGDYIPIYDRRTKLQSIFWTVIVLGVLVSIASGIALKAFFP